MPKRGQGDVKSVHLVVLAGVARGEKTGSGRELGGDVHNPLSGGNQAQGHRAPQPSGTFHRPAALRETLAPTHKRAQTGSVGGENGVLKQLSAFVDGREGVGGLVGIDADQYLHVDLLPALPDNVCRSVEDIPTWG